MKRILAIVRKGISTALEIAGLIVVALAAWQVSSTLGLLAAGAALVFIGYASGIRK